MNSQLRLILEPTRKAGALELAAKFRADRQRKRLTQRQVAHLANCAQSSVAKIEDPKHYMGEARGFPSMQLVRRVCEVYGIHETEVRYRIDLARQIRPLEIGGEMRNTAGVGSKRNTCERNIEPVRFVDEIDVPELKRPGMDPETLCVFGVWALVIVLAAWSFVYWGYLFYQGRIVGL